MAASNQIENIYERNNVRSGSCTSGVRNKNDTNNCQRSTAKCQNKMQSGKHLYDKKTNTADSSNGRNTVMLPNGPDGNSRTNVHKKNCSKTTAISPRKSEHNPNGSIPRCSEADVTAVDELKPYEHPLVSGGSEKSTIIPNGSFLLPKDTYSFPTVPRVNADMSSHSSENVNKKNDRSGIQSRSFEKKTHLDHSMNSDSGNNPDSMDFAHDSAQQNRTYLQGQVGSGISGQDQLYLQQDREINLTEPTRLQCNHQQRNQNEDIVPVLERVRSPEHATLTAREHTFSRWPSDIEQTPAHLAEAGFYYTGFQDTVRCFACDGGLKNWDPEDDPWIVHARWFPQCSYVRHLKGEKFINRVRMASHESDEEDDYTADGGAASGGVENSSIKDDSATKHGMNENIRLKELRLCIECKSRQQNILFLPCTHCVVCDQCSRNLHICTQCDRKIKDKVRRYRV